MTDEELLRFVLCLHPCATYNGQEFARGCRRTNMSGEKCTRGVIASIDSAGGIGVGTNIGAFEGRACERTLGARIGQNLSVELVVRSGRSVTPNRSGGCRG